MTIYRKAGAETPNLNDFDLCKFVTLMHDGVLCVTWTVFSLSLSLSLLSAQRFSTYFVMC